MPAAVIRMNDMLGMTTDFPRCDHRELDAIAEGEEVLDAEANKHTCL